MKNKLSKSITQENRTVLMKIISLETSDSSAFPSLTRFPDYLWSSLYSILKNIADPFGFFTTSNTPPEVPVIEVPVIEVPVIDNEGSSQPPIKQWENIEDMSLNLYEGELKNDLPDGVGFNTSVLNGSISSTYYGEWEKGKYHGMGKLTYPSGLSYIGKWLNGKENGHGVRKFPNGSSYVGNWKDGKYHGKGTMTFPNDSSYVGEWEDGKYHGIGIQSFIMHDGQKHFLQAFFTNGAFEKLTAESFKEHLKGKSCSITFEEGLTEDNGALAFIYTNQDQWLYIIPQAYSWEGLTGYFASSETLNDPNSRKNIIYIQRKGDTYFVSQNADNSIVLSSNNPQVPTIYCKRVPQGKYVGECKNGIPHGRGSLTYQSGMVYKGEFKDGERHGQGELKLTTGEVHTVNS